MDEEKLNLSVRRFLKNVGITSQRTLEDKVRKLIATNTIQKSKVIKVTAKVSSEELEVDETIVGEIEIDI